MIWDAKNAKALEAFAGTYSLPGGCWAVLSLTRSPPKDASTLAAYPEGYRYTWAILAPGEPPSLRGHRMAVWTTATTNTSGVRSTRIRF